MNKTGAQNELAELRWEFLERNPAFVREYEEFLEEARGEIRPGELEQWIEARNAFFKRWGFYDKVMEWTGERKDGPVRFTRRATLNPAEPTLIIEINLAYPLKELMKQLKSEIECRQRELRDDIRETVEMNCNEEISSQEWEQICDEHLEDMRCYRRHPLKRLKGDLDKYREALKVYDRRENGAGWPKISKELHIDGQTARNRYRQAKKYIEHGLPCFPPFSRP